MLEIKNVWNRPLKLEKLVFKEGEIMVGKVIEPGESAKIELKDELPTDFSINYEVSLNLMSFGQEIKRW